MKMKSSVNSHARSIGALISGLAFVLIATAPVLAQSTATTPDPSGLVSFSESIEWYVVKVGQAIISIVVAYYLAYTGISGISRREIKRIGVAAFALILLESYNQIIIEPAQAAASTSVLLLLMIPLRKE